MVVHWIGSRSVVLLICLFVTFGGMTVRADDDPHEEEEESEAAIAVLFPPFALTVGVVTFYVLSRYLKALPYTAVMFLIGALMGITAALGGGDSELAQTLTAWVRIVGFGCQPTIVYSFISHKWFLAASRFTGLRGSATGFSTGVNFQGLLRYVALNVCYH